MPETAQASRQQKGKAKRARAKDKEEGPRETREPKEEEKVEEKAQLPKEAKEDQQVDAGPVVEITSRPTAHRRAEDEESGPWESSGPKGKEPGEKRFERYRISLQ